MNNKYKINDVVYFVKAYGDTFSDDKLYKYGDVEIGIVSDIENITTRNSYLYTILYALESKEKQDLTVHIVLGEHMIYPLTRKGYVECLNKCKEMCVEVED